MKKLLYKLNLILIKIKSYLRISYILLNYNDACFKCVIRGIFGKTPSKDTIKYMKMKFQKQIIIKKYFFQI